MKKFIHAMGEIKFITALYFMAAIMLGSIGSYYFHGLREFSFVTIWQLLGMSAVFGGLHFIQLSKLQPLIRITVHSISSYVTIVLFSLFCNWGFTESITVFWQFTVIFLAIYALLFFTFSLYYKNEEIYLNKKLDEYKQKSK